MTAQEAASPAGSSGSEPAPSELSLSASVRNAVISPPSTGSGTVSTTTSTVESPRSPSTGSIPEGISSSPGLEAAASDSGSRDSTATAAAARLLVACAPGTAPFDREAPAARSLAAALRAAEPRVARAPGVALPVLAAPVDAVDASLDRPSSVVSAHATPPPENTAAPTPRATANPPTRPTNRDAPMMIFLPNSAEPAPQSSPRGWRADGKSQKSSVARGRDGVRRRIRARRGTRRTVDRPSGSVGTGKHRELTRWRSLSTRCDPARRS